MYLQLAVLAIAAFLFFRAISWQTCVKLALYLLVFEGALRKWVFPSATMYLFFLKDGVLLVSYLKYLFADKHYARLPLTGGLKTLILFHVAYCILQISNPNLGSPLVGILGARNYIFYMPLVVLIRDMFHSTDDFVKFWRQYLLLVFPVIGLAFVQYFSPPNSPINTYAAGEEAANYIAMIGKNVRVTGTFSYLGGFGVFVQFCSTLALPLLMINQTSKWRAILWIEFILIFVGAVFSGSRGVLFFIMIQVVGYLCMNRVVIALGLYKKFLVPICFLVMLLLLGLNTAVDNFINRATGSDSMTARTVSAYTRPFINMSYSGLWGYGVGATYQGSGPLRKAFGLPQGTPLPVSYEPEIERIVLELGSVGFLTWYAMRFYIFYLLWCSSRRLRLPVSREMSLSIFLMQVLSLNLFIVFNVYAGIFFWVSVGMFEFFRNLEGREVIS